MALVKSLDLIARERNTVGRERARGQYGAAEYIGAKLLAELPLDAAVAGAFGAALHARCGLRMPRGTLVGILALSAACCASLGLAVGEHCSVVIAIYTSHSMCVRPNLWAVVMTPHSATISIYPLSRRRLTRAECRRGDGARDPASRHAHGARHCQPGGRVGHAARARAVTNSLARLAHQVDCPSATLR